MRELRRIVREAPPDEVLRYAKTHKVLAEELGAAIKNVSAVRKSILAQIRAEAPVDPGLRELTREGGLSGSLLDIVSTPLVRELLNDVLALCGKDRLLAAMLIDSRPAIRQLAADRIRKGYDAPLSEPDEAKRRVEGRLSPFLRLLAPWLDVDPEGDWEDDEWDAPEEGGDVAELKEEVAKRDADLKKHKEQARREILRLNKKGNVLSEKNQKLQKELEAVRTQVKKQEKLRLEAGDALRRAEDKARRQEETLEESIRDGVDERLSSALNTWLRKPRELEREAEGIRRSAGTDLPARAEQLLKRQAEVDKHSGNLALLRSQVEQLDGSLERLRAARREALHPLAELAQLESEIEAELSRLRTALQEPVETPDAAVQKLLARINEANAPDALLKYQDFLAGLGELDVFGTSQLQQLYRCYHDRMAMLYAAFTPTVKKVKPFRNDPAWRLRNAMAGNEQLVLVLDGHNVLHLLPEVFGSTYDERGVPRSEARDKLVTSLVRLFADAPGCQARVFFDSPAHSRETVAPNVTVVFSGGGEQDAQHRADRAIIDFLEHCCRNMSAMPRILATDDRELRDKARELGASFMPVAQFGAFLEEL